MRREVMLHTPQVVQPMEGLVERDRAARYPQGRRINAGLRMIDAIFTETSASRQAPPIRQRNGHLPEAGGLMQIDIVYHIDLAGRSQEDRRCRDRTLRIVIPARDPGNLRSRLV